ncbi:MAG: hypothetical protein LBN42_00960 [Oscillospiraceae bacterium]|jgi:D-alanyl-D-alanine carboxypeptidase|nr:hypothetical protein [Oscillospiraceae bacterium]
MKKKLSLLIASILLITSATACKKIPLDEYNALHSRTYNEGQTTEETNTSAPSDTHTTATGKPDLTANWSTSLTVTGEFSVSESVVTEPPIINVPNFVTGIQNGVAKYTNANVMNAENAAIYNIDTGELVYLKEQPKINPTAAVRILAALTALNYFGEDEQITIGTEVSLSNGTKLKYAKGTVLTLKQAIAASIVGLKGQGANDVAYAIAVNIARAYSKDPDMTDTAAVAAFVNMMKVYAADKLNLTTFEPANPSGYLDSKQNATMRDILTILAAAAENPTITDVCAIKTTAAGKTFDPTFPSSTLADNGGYAFARVDSYWYFYGLYTNKKGERLIIHLSNGTETNSKKDLAKMLEYAVNGIPLE